MSAGATLPQLSLSSGPAISGAPITVSTGTGDFAIGGAKAGLIERALPLVLIGGVVWLMTRR